MTFSNILHLYSRKLRHEAGINCSSLSENDDKFPCRPLKEDCLFDIIKDPCERNNIASK